MRKSQLQRVGILTIASTAVILSAPMFSAPVFAGPRDNGGNVNLAQALKKTTLVFPYDLPASVPNKLEVQQLLADMTLSRLLAANSYSVTLFSKSLPTVARLHNDQQLSDSDISEPYAEGVAKAGKIGKLASYDVAFLGSVVDYQYDDGAKSASVVLTGQLIDVKTGKPVSTPVTLSGSSTKGSTKKEPDLAMDAFRNAGEQLLQKLIPVTVVNTTPTKVVVAKEPAKKKKGNDLLWGLLAVGLGLGIGIASSGRGGAGGGGGDTPPGHP